MKPGFALLLCLAATIMVSPAKAEPYSWREMVQSLESISGTFETGAATAGPAYAFDLGRLCQDDAATFAATVVGEGCADGGCSTRREGLAGEAKALAAEMEQRINDPETLAGSDAARFVPPGLRLTSVPRTAAEQLRLRAAHDLWLRSWSDPMLASSDRPGRDRWMLVSRVWCVATRGNADAAIAYVDQFGFSPEDPAIAPTIINIAIHAAWDRALTYPLHQNAEAAFGRGELAGFYAAHLADIDAMATTGQQRVGTLFSCERGVAYPDPPMADPEAVETVRESYGFGTLDDAIASRSRTCPAE